MMQPAETQIVTIVKPHTISNRTKLIYMKTKQEEKEKMLQNSASFLSSSRRLADAVHLGDVELHGHAVGPLVCASLDPVVR